MEISLTLVKCVSIRFRGFPKMDTEDVWLTFLKKKIPKKSMFIIYLLHKECLNQLFRALQGNKKNLFFPTARIKKNNLDVLSSLWTACLHDLSIWGGALLSSCLYSSLVYFCNNWAGRGLALGTLIQTETFHLSLSLHATPCLVLGLNLKTLCTLVWMTSVSGTQAK